jgi:hypothetical protein
MRDDSGWNTAEPKPISEADTITSSKVGANASSSKPHSVEHMPTGNA